MEGTYSLKLATRPKPQHMGQAIKRLTLPQKGRIQFETYFTYKAEQIFREREDGTVWEERKFLSI